MSLSTFAAETRRTLDTALDAGASGAPPSVAPSPGPPPPAAAMTGSGAQDAESCAAAEGAAERFFPSQRDDHYGSWRGRHVVDADTMQWRGSAEFGSRDLGWGGATVGGVAVAAGGGGVGADAVVARLDARVGAHGAARLDALQAGAAFGVLQGDGSRGLGLSAGANALGGELSYDRGGFRGSLGASAGVGAGASLGVRDADGDGRTEVCSSVSAGPVTVGGCYEPYTLAAGVWELGERGVGVVAGLMRP